MKKVPNLIFKSALDYCIYLSNHTPTDEDQFDFKLVKTCEPFTMLLTATAIRQYRKRIQYHSSHDIPPTGCINTYADTMRFYRASGINKGKSFEEDYGNGNYLPITQLDIAELRETGLKNYEVIQEQIVKKSKEMSAVLSRDNKFLANMLTYALTEIMRNVPEHSSADSIWYSSQYWPSKDCVELAFLDEGIGIQNSFLNNPAFSQIIDNDTDALLHAIKPGISSAFSPNSQNLSYCDWANSGFGLYMISSLCAELGGDFIIVSGKSALKISKDKKTQSIVHNIRDCSLNGTAVRLRISPSKIDNYEEISKKILHSGELSAKNRRNAITSASKSSKSIFQ